MEVRRRWESLETTKKRTKERIEREDEREDEARGLGYKLSGDDSIAYRPLGSPEEVFHVLLRYTILYEEHWYEGVQVTNTPNYVSLN